MPSSGRVPASGVGASVVAIVNPRASNGAASRRWPAVQAALRRHWPNLAVRQTEAPEHATQLTREVLEDGAEMVISVGGDGTNNEVLGGFVDAKGRNRFPEAILGVIASGTGGDFQRMWGPLEPHRQVDRLARAPVRTIDYGLARFTGHEGQQVIRPFLNIASVGISGLVDRYVNSGGRMFGNTVAYVAASLKGIVAYENRRVVLTFEDGDPRELDLSLLVIGNGQYFGAGMWACPEAELDDGAFDTILLPGFRKPDIVKVLAKVFAGKHLDFPGLESGRAKKISLRPALPGTEVLLDIDGEQPGRLPATFEVVPQSLRLRIA